VPQGMQAYLPAANSTDSARPFAAERVWHERPAVPRREHKISWRASANAECEALLVLRPPMRPQFADSSAAGFCVIRPHWAECGVVVCAAGWRS